MTDNSAISSPILQALTGQQQAFQSLTQAIAAWQTSDLESMQQLQTEQASLRTALETFLTQLHGILNPNSSETSPNHLIEQLQALQSDLNALNEQLEANTNGQMQFSQQLETLLQSQARLSEQLEQLNRSQQQLYSKLTSTHPTP